MESALAVPCPLAAGISAFRHSLELASNSLLLLLPKGGLLKAAPTGLSVSAKSNKNFIGPGSMNLGNLANRGSNGLGFEGFMLVTLSN